MPDPINLLTQILNSRLTISVESSDKLIAKIQKSINRRINELAEKNKKLKKKKKLEIKKPQVVQALVGSQTWSIRPIDLLRKLGEMTTPPFLPLENMPKLSASWATFRYFWAIDPSPAKASGPFRLSAEARRLDFHQKTLLSDEFGIGLAGLFLEQRFGAPECIDMSYAVENKKEFQNVSLNLAVSPDYLMWGSGTPYYVVECKGCQTTQAVAIDQIRRGLEQVISVSFGSGPNQSETLVVSTFLAQRKTRLFVVDPPEDEERDRGESQRRWVLNIEDREAFTRRTSLGSQARLLVWAGLYESAARVAHELHVPIRPFQGVERHRVTRATPSGKYEGTVSPLFPELGRDGLSVFTGVVPELLTPAPNRAQGGERPDDLSSRRDQPLNEAPFNESYGANGTCMIVEGL